MKVSVVYLLPLTLSVAAAEMSQLSHGAMNAPATAKSTVTVPDANLSVSPETSTLEEGKALYENGQFIAALGKFMTVLRKDPHQPEARLYLRRVVDIMRQNPSIAASKLGAHGGQAVTTSPLVQEEVRKMLQQRSLFTLDLKAIPGVRFSIQNNMHQVQIDTTLLFAENSGGLKEPGIPILDRVAAWLKTYGQQPVIIHCYPEELRDPATNGGLFLHRYSELFSFFVEERKLPPQRFVSADLLKEGTPAPDSAVGVSTTAVIVIETMGSQSAALEDAMPSVAPGKKLSRWLELSIVPIRPLFNPEEGEWTNLDVAALTRMGVRDWTLTLVPTEGKNPQPVLHMQGKGNLLKRVSWDGHDQDTGSFVPAGSYLAKLVATDADGTIMNREVTLQVLRTTAAPPVASLKPKTRVAKKSTVKKPKTIQVAKAVPPAAPPVAAKRPVAAPPVNTPSAPAAPKPAAVDDSDSLIDSKDVPSPTRGEGPPGRLGGDEATTARTAVASPPPSPKKGEGVSETAATATAEDGGDSVHAIWKQVIQFEPNQSGLKPTVKASLERIGKTLEVYPLQKVRITGFAMTSEANAAELAGQRAEAVRSILVDEYHVDKKRVIVAGGKTTAAENASKVEMSITN